jgi:4-alpha-glucanotransferase
MHPPAKRTAGILLPAFAPRRKGDLGIGDTLALREWIDWAADHDVGFLQMLPINEHGVEESPYSSISSVALDPVYLSFDPPEIPGLTPDDVARARRRLGDAADSPKVDYPAVRRVKRTLLELAWADFDLAADLLREEFEVYRRTESSWLDDYCLFRFLMEHHGAEKTWDEWPENCRTPESARAFVATLRLRDPDAVDRQLGYHAFVQWLCFRQWRALRAHAELRGVKLMGDVPIGVSWHSVDVFFHREEFHLDWFGGSPPEGQDDAFFRQWGQNWGIPLYRWDHMEANGFHWWKQRIARLSEFFEIYRIDHILGFYRIYAFPWHPRRNPEFIGLSHDQAADRTGGRLPKWELRADDSLENMAANRDDGDRRLRGILGDTADGEVIAEDLGWVPEYVRPHLADLGIARFMIPHWDCDEHGHPVPGNCVPELTFACYSTHDHDPLGATWRSCRQTVARHRDHPGDDTGWRADGAAHALRLLAEFAGIPVPADGRWPDFTEGIRWRLIKALFASNSRYASLMVTELFDLDVRINQPGRHDGENWRFRLPWTLAEITADPHLSATGNKLRSIIGITRRGRT